MLITAAELTPVHLLSDTYGYGDCFCFTLDSHFHGVLYFVCGFLDLYRQGGGGRVVRWCWVNFQCRGVLLIWIIVEQGPTALAKGGGGGCLDIFFLSYIISLLFLPLSGRRPDTNRSTVSKDRLAQNNHSILSHNLGRSSGQHR